MYSMLTSSKSVLVVRDLIPCFALSPRLHAHRRWGGRPETSGRPTRGAAGLRGRPAHGRPAPGGQDADDAAAAEADLHQGRAALLQHQTGRQGPHAQTFFGNARGQGLTKSSLGLPVLHAEKGKINPRVMSKKHRV